VNNFALMRKKMMSMVLTLPFTCVAFIALGDFGCSVYGSCVLP
jgi:hypothetical protein